MAEDTGDKTEAPTPRRRAEAREQGNVARSQDLTLALMMLGVMLTLNITGPRMVNALKVLVQKMLAQDSMSDLNPAAAPGDALHAVYVAGYVLAPLLIAVIVIACLANLVQVGILVVCIGLGLTGSVVAGAIDESMAKVRTGYVTPAAAPPEAGAR